MNFWLGSIHFFSREWWNLTCSSCCIWWPPCSLEIIWGWPPLFPKFILISFSPPPPPPHPKKTKKKKESLGEGERMKKIWLLHILNGHKQRTDIVWYKLTLKKQKNKKVRETLGASKSNKLTKYLLHWMSTIWGWPCCF